jgi:hypothetical protein
MELVGAVIGFSEAVGKGSGEDDPIDLLIFEMSDGVIDDGVKLGLYLFPGVGCEGEGHAGDKGSNF